MQDAAPVLGILRSPEMITGESCAVEAACTVRQGPGKVVR
jgi:hypothetical protein